MVIKKLKNLFLVLLSLIFAFGVLSISVWKTRAQTSSKSFKLEKIALVSDEGMGFVPSPSPAPKIDYYLPYPGILPDNILYPLKMVRDRILLFLTFDPVKKAEKLLLFADKRVNAARSLIEGGKIELGISTLTKAEKYLERAINQAEEARKAGKNTFLLDEKLVKATLKHQEVLGEVLEKVPEEAKASIQDALSYSRKGYETVVRVIEQKAIREQEREEEQQQNQGEEKQIREEEQEREGQTPTIPSSNFQRRGR